MSSIIRRFDGKEIEGSCSRGSGVFAAFDWEDLVLCSGPKIRGKATPDHRGLASFPAGDQEALSACRPINGMAIYTPVDPQIPQADISPADLSMLSG